MMYTVASLGNAGVGGALDAESTEENEVLKGHFEQKTKAGHA